MESNTKNDGDVIDVTSPEYQETLHVMADELLSAPDFSVEKMRSYVRKAQTPVHWRIAAWLAVSRFYLLGIARPLEIGVVFAMWGEQNRLRPRNACNPHGEDSLRTKIRQLQWACEGTAVEWALYPVDDGCPYGSGKVAAEIAAQFDMDNRIRVLFLEDHLPAAAGPLKKLSSADDSRKAGSIILGCGRAIDEGAEAVVYTDADNSVHMGQVGLLLKPYTQDGFNVVLGNRKHPDSILVKDGARWGIGIKNLRHMQRMVGESIFSRGILDTQAAFKLYESRLLREIIASPTVFDFSFDTDWIAAFISRNEPFAQVPFVFVDSAAESATAKQQPMTTWETLLLGLLRSMRRHDLLLSPASREMARVIEEEIKDYRDLERLIDHLPRELENATEAEYGDPSVMAPAAMQAWIRRRKACS